MENKTIYLLRDLYDKDIIICGLVFNTDENICFKDIDKTIDDIKNEFRENDYNDWKFDDILDELHGIFDFEEIDFNYNQLYI